MTEALQPEEPIVKPAPGGPKLAAGVTCWVDIGPPPLQHYRLGIDLVLGSSTLGLGNSAT